MAFSIYTLLRRPKVKSLRVMKFNLGRKSTLTGQVNDFAS